jgi:hypothetical protein
LLQEKLLRLEISFWLTINLAMLQSGLKAQLGLRARLAQLDQQELQGRQELQERQEPQELQVLMASTEIKELLVALDHKAEQVPLVLVLTALTVIKEQRETPAHKGYWVIPAVADLLAQQELLELLEWQELTVFPVLMENWGPQVLLGLQVLRGQQGRQELQGRQESMAFLDLMENWEPQEVLGLQAPRV